MLYERKNKKNRDYNSDYWLEKRTRKTSVDIFGLSHLTAGKANVPVCSEFSIGPLICGIKPIDTKDECVQIEKAGPQTEITDYAILQGGEYWEEKDNNNCVKRLGTYWTDTTVERAEPLPKIEYIECINTYQIKKVETCYTFYGYEMGEKCDKNTDPCIVEIGTKLFLNNNGNLFELSRESSWFDEATIGQSMSLQSPPIREKIHFYSKGAYVGATDKIIEYYTKMIEKDKIMKKLKDGEYKYIGGRNHSNIAEISNCKVGIRPVINTYNFAAIDIFPEDDIKHVSFTEFPQTVVSFDMEKILEKLYKKDKLNITGVSYPTSLGERAIEYEYNGKKYVRVIAKLCEENTPAKLSNGCKYNNGDIAWVSVEPVSLLVDKDNMTSVCEKIIFAGVPYNQTLNVDAITCYKSSQFAMSFLNGVEQYLFTNYYNSDSKIVSGTEWMQSYHRTKERYEEAQIPFEETEKDAAKRYIDENNKINSNIKYITDKSSPILNYHVIANRIEYSYRPSIEFLNSIDDPIVAVLAAIGPKDIWSSVYFKEYFKAYGTWALLKLKEEEIKRMADRVYDEKLEKTKAKVKK